MLQVAHAVYPPIVASSPVVFAGVDTHKDLHVAAVIDTGENVLGTQSFSTTRAGYRALIRWLRSFGDVLSAYDLTCPTAYGLTCRAVGVLRPC
jgi:transposase